MYPSVTLAGYPPAYRSPHRACDSSKGKVPTDMEVAQSADPDGVLSLAARIFHVDGIPAADLLAATIEGTKVDSPAMKVSQ